MDDQTFPSTFIQKRNRIFFFILGIQVIQNFMKAHFTEKTTYLKSNLKKLLWVQITHQKIFYVKQNRFILCEILRQQTWTTDKKNGDRIKILGAVKTYYTQLEY